MKAEKKNPLTGAMMDVTKVHFSLFFLSNVKGTVFFTPLKSETQLLSLVQRTLIEYIQHYFFAFSILMSGGTPLLPNRHFDFGTSNARER